MPMDNFFKIRAEKQNHIINAAFSIFGRQGYRKASLSDIAKEAGITKGMITYYFGSKKTLYVYLVEKFHLQLVENIKEQMSSTVDNFFDRLRMVVDVNVSVIKEHPAIISFSNSFYKETDPEVMEEIKKIDTADNETGINFFLKGIDESSFKPGIDMNLVCRFMFWAFEGCLVELYESNYDESEVDELIDRLYKSLDIMQQVFSK